MAAFAEDVAIRRYAEHANPIVRWSDFDTGGHFGAMESPTCSSATSATSSAGSADTAVC